MHRLGLLTSKSGPGAVFAMACDYLARLAVEEINAEGGLCGQPVELVVRDHGIGIAPEDQQRIFERFERAVPARGYGGLGIGLWVVREVASQMQTLSSPAGTSVQVRFDRAAGGVPRH